MLYRLFLCMWPSLVVVGYALVVASVAMFGMLIILATANAGEVVLQCAQWYEVVYCIPVDRGWDI